MSRFLKLHRWNAVGNKRGERIIVNTRDIKTAADAGDKCVLMIVKEPVLIDCTLDEMGEWLEADYKIGKIK